MRRTLGRVVEGGDKTSGDEERYQVPLSSSNPIGTVKNLQEITISDMTAGHLLSLQGYKVPFYRYTVSSNSSV